MPPAARAGFADGAGSDGGASPLPGVAALVPPASVNVVTRVAELSATAARRRPRRVGRVGRGSRRSGPYEVMSFNSPGVSSVPGLPQPQQRYAPDRLVTIRCVSFLRVFPMAKPDPAR